MNSVFSKVTLFGFLFSVIRVHCFLVYNNACSFFGTHVVYIVLAVIGVVVKTSHCGYGITVIFR